MNLTLAKLFGIGVLVGGVIESIWIAISHGALGHPSPHLGYLLQTLILILWPTSIFMMAVGPGTGTFGSLAILGLSLFFNGFLYTIIGYVIIKLFHLVSK